MLKNFNKHNVYQLSPANINSYKLLATFTSGAGRLSKRRSKRRSVNPALYFIIKVRYSYAISLLRPKVERRG